MKWDCLCFSVRTVQLSSPCTDVLFEIVTSMIFFMHYMIASVLRLKIALLQYFYSTMTKCFEVQLLCLDASMIQCILHLIL